MTGEEKRVTTLPPEPSGVARSTVHWSAAAAVRMTSPAIALYTVRVSSACSAADSRSLRQARERRCRRRHTACRCLLTTRMLSTRCSGWLRVRLSSGAIGAEPGATGVLTLRRSGSVAAGAGSAEAPSPSCSQSVSTSSPSLPTSLSEPSTSTSSLLSLSLSLPSSPSPR